MHAVSNVKFYNDLLGDSAFITSYLKWIGWDLSKVVQTGSNFGMVQQHDNPLLCKIGTGTMVSDGLTMKNAQISTSSFKVSRTELGDHNYLGNLITYPSDGRTGDNCLLATKVMIPTDGPVRENVGLLGSPCFEIPRASKSDQDMSQIDENQRAVDLKKKTAHNLGTMLISLTTRWLFGNLALLLSLTAITYYNSFGMAALAGGAIAGYALMIGYFVALEWLSLGFRKLQPFTSTIYDHRFWSVERHWKVADTLLAKMFGGTPFKNVISCMLGVKVGKRVFDDGCMLTEKTLSSIVTTAR